MMQKHEHVKTVPGEQVAPEVVVNPIRVEEDAHTQTDDINIPLVAVSVLFFAMLMLVLVLGLQAWIYNAANSEKLTKTVPQGSAGTALGDMLAKDRSEMYVDKVVPNDRMGKDSKAMRIPIDRAMELVVNDYAQAQGATVQK
jgi:hypothetical protein